MKLWQVIQWGNAEGGPDEQDTQVIISASDMMAAINKAEPMFEDNYRLHALHGHKPAWARKEADVVYLLGEDNRPDGEPILIIQLWEQHAFNFAHNPSWHRHFETGEWLDAKTMYGE